MTIRHNFILATHIQQQLSYNMTKRQSLHPCDTCAEALHHCLIMSVKLSFQFISTESVNSHCHKTNQRQDKREIHRRKTEHVSQIDDGCLYRR